MKEWRNNCMGCSTESYPCLGDACQYRHVPYLICDECGDDNCEELYVVDEEELCEDCFLKRFPTITIDDMLWEGEF